MLQLTLMVLFSSSGLPEYSTADIRKSILNVTGQLADMPTRRLDISRTGQLTD